MAFVAFAVSGETAGSADFHTGDAQATADTFSLNLKAANATIGFTYGRSIAGYQDRTGSSEGRALDLGALPTLFGGTQCDGSPPLIDPATLPPLTTANSTDAGSDQSHRAQAFLPGIDGAPPGAAVGFQDATATTKPSATAITESVPADLGLIAVTGGKTDVTAELDGHVREAHAVVTADELRVFGNLFTFTKPRWEATARSGDETVASGGFSFERATVLGIPRSAADALRDLKGFKAGLEQLLQPLGVKFDLPAVTVTSDGVTVTPMGFRIVNPPFGTKFLIPFLGQIDPLVQSLRKQAVAEDCKNQTVLTVIDVLLGVLGGSGSAEVLVGGVDVSTHDVDYTVAPIPDSPTSADTTPATVADSSLAFDDSSFDTGVAPDTGFSDLATTPDDSFSDLTAPGRVPTPATARRPVAAAAALPTASVDRFEDGTAGKAGVAVGAVALLGALAMSVGDRLIGRRAKRRIT